MSDAQQIQLREPTRTEMRMLFEMAIGGAKTQGGRQAAAEIALYFEARWQELDKAPQGKGKNGE